MKVYISLPKILSANTVTFLQESGYEINYNKNGNLIPQEQLASLIKNADGVLAGTEIYSKETLSNCKKLKCISRVGESKNNIDCDYAEKEGISICTVSPEIRLKYVAEMTISALLSISYNISNKPGFKTKNVSNSNILILGSNALCDKIVSLLEGFNANIHIYDKNKEIPFKYYCSIRKEIMNSDTIIVTSNLNEVLPKDVFIFDHMKKSTILLDVPGNKFLFDNVRGLISQGFISAYWTTLKSEGICDTERCFYTQYTNFQSIQFLKEIEEAATINLIHQLGRD